MMVAILAIGPAVRPEREKLLLMLGASLFVLRAGWTVAQWWQADRVLLSRLALLDHVPQGSRRGFMSAEDECRSCALSQDRTIGVYAIPRRGSSTNKLFKIHG